MCKTVCCFLGHRKIDETEELILQVYDVIKRLIEDGRVDTFLFGSKSDFCVIYYREDYALENRKSGTKLALDYAMKKNKEIIILP